MSCTPKCLPSISSFTVSTSLLRAAMCSSVVAVVRASDHLAPLASSQSIIHLSLFCAQKKSAVPPSCPFGLAPFEMRNSAVFVMLPWIAAKKGVSPGWRACASGSAPFLSRILIMAMLPLDAIMCMHIAPLPIELFTSAPFLSIISTISLKPLLHARLYGDILLRLSGLLRPAPRLMSISTIFTSPRPVAKWIGSLSIWSALWISEPASMSSSAHSWWPKPTASASAVTVEPPLTIISLLTSYFATSIRCASASAAPVLAA
mmetsp:Transcript_10944/g.27262  ORF Transcript_10944/g.27262 Transcript_10944/m.27262 type:complete len:261 (+) Transcript_10944:1462-2244(+)